MKSFSSSILNFGPWLTPYHIDIEDTYVRCRKNNGFGVAYLTSTTVSLKKNKITNIMVIDQLFWCDIKIVTSSGEVLYLRHFSRGDAEEIKQLIHP